MQASFQASRRSFLSSTAGSLCSVALHALMEPERLRAEPVAAKADLEAKPVQHRARAQSVIHRFMNGGPSQMDLFDPKPELDRHAGKSFPG
ncbi:MAG: DUF1501 domain-containing protein, partial [Planctomycetaceae bacterium]